MKNHQRFHNMDDTKRSRNYDKEMDHAFTLIFHNIKRLQDGHLSNSAPILDQADSKSGTSPANRLHLPSGMERSGSDPSLQGIQTHTGASDPIRPKSRSFCGGTTSPTQRRKVTFFDDYATTKEQVKRPALTRRPWSELPSNPLIVVTKES